MDIDPVATSLIHKMQFTIAALTFEVEELRGGLGAFSALYLKFLSDGVTDHGANPDPVVSIPFGELRAADACLTFSHESAIARVKELDESEGKL